MSKGSQWERDICVKLSLWASNNRREDIFWRSQGSGARARVRGRRKKRTEGQHGDICATDPIGSFLLDLFTIELKRGYSGKSIIELLDKPKHLKRPDTWEEWIAKAQESMELSGSWSWLIISKRDKRDALVTMPSPDFVVISSYRDYHSSRPLPQIPMEDCCDYRTVKLDDWLNRFPPEFLKGLKV